jgi:hypothetical protein
MLRTPGLRPRKSCATTRNRPVCQSFAAFAPPTLYAGNVVRLFRTWRHSKQRSTRIVEFVGGDFADIRSETQTENSGWDAYFPRGFYWE